MDKKEFDSLMCKIQTGDEQAFSLFYQNTFKGVFSFIYSYVKNYHIAEDLLQETYIKIKRNVDKYTKGTNAIAWVLQIAKNICLDYLRAERTQFAIEAIQTDLAKQDNIIENLYLHDVINKHIADGDRQIIILHLIYGYKNKEIAKILQMPIGTVLWKYNKSMKILKKILDEEA